MRDYDRLILSIAFRYQRQLTTVGLDADDLKGHIYEKLLENGCGRMLAWKGKAKFSTFLVMVARNLAMDFIAMHTKGAALKTGDDIEEQGAEDAGLEETDLSENQLLVLKDILDELPDSQAVIIRMRMEGKTLREIAKALNRPVGTVSVENSRILKTLQKKLRLRHPDLWEGEAGS